MGNDLVKLYRELSQAKQDVTSDNIRLRIEERLYEQMRHHFLDLIEIGSAIGYDRLDEELRRAADMVGKLKKI